MKILLFLILLVFLWKEFFIKWPDQYFHLVMCDVGQGDAILLSAGYVQILIDTGPNEEIVSCLSSNMPFWDKKIDILVITHFDDDHIGGFKHLSQSYSISNVYLPLTDYKESAAYLEMRGRLTAMQDFGTKLKQPFLGQQISFMEFSPEYQTKYNSTIPLEMVFLTPIKFNPQQFELLEENSLLTWESSETKLSAQNWQKIATNEGNNNGSIALKVRFGDLNFLLLGDLEVAGELALMQQGLISQVDIQKVGHHGSKTASSLEFLLFSRPEIALISCGAGNKFGHPHPEVLDNFHATNAKMWRTDEMGDIEIVSDGQKFWLKDEK